MTGFYKFTLSILTNEGIIKMHKNARHSHQVWRRTAQDGCEHILWTAVSSEGGTYIAVFNAGDRESTVSVSLAELEIYSEIKGTELWSGQKLTAAEGFEVLLPAHGAKAFYVL